jgi:hypothetical protein
MESDFREKILDLIIKYNEETTGSSLLSLIVDGGWDGSICPSHDVCHSLLWKVGCTDSRILSRNIPDLLMKRDKNPFQKLIKGSQRLTSWNHFVLDKTPIPGDIVLCGDKTKGELEKSYIFMSIDGKSNWKLFSSDVYKSKIKTKIISKKPDGIYIDDNGKKTIMGWVNLDMTLE